MFDPDCLLNFISLVTGPECLLCCTLHSNEEILLDCEIQLEDCIECEIHSNDKIPVLDLWQGGYMMCFQQITRDGTKRNCIYISSGKRQ